MEAFEGIDEVDTGSERPPFIKEGKYRIRIDQVTLGKTRKKQSFYSVTGTVVESDNVEHPEGSQLTHMTMQHWPSFLPTVKNFLAAALKLKPEAITQETAAEAVSPEQPLADIELVAVATNNVSQKTGKTFTNVKYYPAQD